MKTTHDAIGENPTHVFQMHVLGWTLAIHVNRWKGLYGFKESRGLTISFTGYEDHPSDD